MKHFVLYLFLVIISISIFFSISYAQEVNPYMHFSIFGGAAFPVGDFSSTTAIQSGYANTGYCAMIEADKNISQDIYWTSSASLAINEIDQNGIENSSGGIIGGLEMPVNSSGNYTTTWIMTGFGFELTVSPSIKIYGTGQIGLLISSYPSISASQNGLFITVNSKTGTSFADQLGSGIIINKINLCLRYYAGDPFYKFTINSSSENLTFTNNLGRRDFPITLLLFMIGYNF